MTEDQYWKFADKFKISKDQANEYLTKLDEKVWVNPSSKEHQDIEEHVLDFIKGILGYINETVPNHGIKVIKSGSYYSNLRVGRPYEIDLMMEIPTPEVTILRKMKNSYQIQFRNTSVKVYDIKTALYGLISSSIKKLQAKNIWNVEYYSTRDEFFNHKEGDSPAFTVLLKYPDNIGISVDLVPCVKFPRNFTSMLLPIKTEIMEFLKNCFRNKHPEIKLDISNRTDIIAGSPIVEEKPSLFKYFESILNYGSDLDDDEGDDADDEDEHDDDANDDMNDENGHDDVNDENGHDDDVNDENGHDDDANDDVNDENGHDDDLDDANNKYVQADDLNDCENNILLDFLEDELFISAIEKMEQAYDSDISNSNESVFDFLTDHLRNFHDERILVYDRSYKSYGANFGSDMEKDGIGNEDEILQLNVCSFFINNLYLVFTTTEADCANYCRLSTSLIEKYITANFDVVQLSAFRIVKYLLQTYHVDFWEEEKFGPIFGAKACIPSRCVTLFFIQVVVSSIETLKHLDLKSTLAFFLGTIEHNGPEKLKSYVYGNLFTPSSKFFESDNESDIFGPFVYIFQNCNVCTITKFLLKATQRNDLEVMKLTSSSSDILCECCLSCMHGYEIKMTTGGVAYDISYFNKHSDVPDVMRFFRKGACYLHTYLGGCQNKFCSCRILIYDAGFGVQMRNVKENLKYT